MERYGGKRKKKQLLQMQFKYQQNKRTLLCCTLASSSLQHTVPYRNHGQDDHKTMMKWSNINIHENKIQSEEARPCIHVHIKTKGQGKTGHNTKKHNFKDDLIEFASPRTLVINIKDQIMKRVR